MDGSGSLVIRSNVESDMLTAISTAASIGLAMDISGVEQAGLNLSNLFEAILPEPVIPEITIPEPVIPQALELKLSGPLPTAILNTFEMLSRDIGPLPDSPKPEVADAVIQTVNVERLQVPVLR
jgi:hypothetical protein